MSYSTDQYMDTQLSVFLTISLGFSMLCCLLFNTRLTWLITRKHEDGRAYLHLSPYLLSSCLSETVTTCVFGPVLCISLTQQTWRIGSVMRTFLDCLFLALLWSVTASTFVYSMDRHCLLVQRRLFPKTFGKFRRNALNLACIWILSLGSALPYITLRDATALDVPMTFTFKKNMMYCAHAVVVLYTVPVLITVISLIKTVRDAKMRKKAFHHAASTSQPPSFHSSLVEDFQMYEGLVVSTCVFILTSLPWVWFQLLKALDLIGESSTTSELILMVLLVFGIGLKTAGHVLCSSCIREKFFSNVLRNTSREYNLEPLPVVLTNIAAV